MKNYILTKESSDVGDKERNDKKCFLFKVDHYHIFLILLFCFKIETRITCSSFDWRAVPQSGRKIITICSSNSWIWYNGYKISPLNTWNISLTERNLVMAIMWIRLEIENLSSPLNGITGKSFQALELSREWLIVPHVVLKEEFVVIINCPYDHQQSSKCSTSTSTQPPSHVWSSPPSARSTHLWSWRPSIASTNPIKLPV